MRNWKLEGVEGEEVAYNVSFNEELKVFTYSYTKAYEITMYP